jgi:hypothetical protein
MTNQQEQLEVFDEKEEKIEEEENEEEGIEYAVTTLGTDWTLEVLCKKIERKDIYIPDFQRGIVWNEVKKSKLIDSFLRGFPVPNIFLYKNSENKHAVIDGQQRLWAVKEFFNDGYELKKVSKEWEGMKFSQLSPSNRLKLEDSVIRATIVSSITPENPKIIFRIFERLNTGGVTLYDQEIRNGVWGGKLNNALKELNKDQNWRSLLGKSDPDKRFKDIEMILRFFALVEKWEEYKKPMNEFMTDYLSKAVDEEKIEIQSLFKKTIEIIYNQLGGGAFKLEKNINKAFFDSVSVGIGLCLQENCLSLEKIKENFEKLRLDDELRKISSDTTTDTKNVKRRIEIAYNIFKND